MKMTLKTLGVVVIFGALSLLGFMVLEHNKNLPSNEVMHMIEFIEENTDMVYGGQHVPRIERAPSAKICKFLHPEMRSEDCFTVGYYDHKTNVIAISNDAEKFAISARYYDVVLVHELVHYMQRINGRYEEAECLKALEEDAYSVQNKYIEMNGISEKFKTSPMFVMFISSCGEMDGT